MFILVQEAYRKVENDKDPNLKAAWQEMEWSYESSNEEFIKNFKSRRKE